MQTGCPSSWRDLHRGNATNGASLLLRLVSAIGDRLLFQRRCVVRRHSAVSLRLTSSFPMRAQPDVPIHFPVMSPTHVIFDTSAPSSPGGQSIRTSVLPSLDNSPAYPSMSLSEPSEPRRATRSPTPSPQVMSPNVRLPTPLSDDYPSPRATPPPTMLFERSPLSMRQPPADLSASFPASTSYNTPLGGSLLSEAGGARAYTDPLLNPGAGGSRVQSPFSDIHAADAWASSPEHVSPVAGSAQPAFLDDVRSPSMASDLTLDSDEDFDVMSPRSGMFSPTGRNSHVDDDDPFEVGSQHESEASWTSVGPHSPAHRPF